jgi:uncharacterized membrane protein
MAEVVASFDVLVPDIRRVGVDRPWQWLAAGWRDLVRSPGVSLAFGAAFAAAGYALSLGLWLTDMVYLVLPLAAGFMIVGPVLAVGLYEVSRRHAAGEPVSFRAALAAFERNPRHLAVMGFVLLLVMLTWIRLAIMIFMLYWGLTPPSFEDLIVNTFLRPESLPFLLFGTAVGAVFAAFTFSISAVSLPMLLDRRVDVITAVVTSVRAVRENPAPMLLWAALIAGFTAAGLATLYLGLVVTMPLIGHATWHARRDLVATPGDATAA